MDPYGSGWGDIKTGRSPVAPDHFWTPPDQNKAHKNSKIKKRKTQNLILFLFGPCCYPPEVWK